MQCLTASHADALEREIDDLDAEYDDLQSQPRQLETATRDRRTAFEAATQGHPRQAALLRAIGRGSASGTLEIARAILDDLQARLAAGESHTTTTPSVGAAPSK